MGRFRFIHAADLHLDTPFCGLGRLAPRLADRLRDASLIAFDRLIDLALRSEAAFVVLAGDVYDGADRGLRAQLHFLRGLEKLSQAGIPALIAHGNHDPLDGWSAIQAWPRGVTVFGSGEVAEVVIERRGVPLATVHGLSFARRETTENLARRFKRSAAPGLHAGVLHCNVGGDAEHAPWSPCSVGDLVQTRLDYWALGHIHRARVVRAGDPWIVYPGNLQGRSFKPSERGPKGAMVVEVDGAVVTSARPVALDVARFIEIDVDARGATDVGAVRALLSAAAGAARRDHAGRALLVRARLRCAGPVRALVRSPAALADLLVSLRDEVLGAEPFLHWSALLLDEARDRTGPRAFFAGDPAAELDSLAAELVADPGAAESLIAEIDAALDRLNIPRELAASGRADAAAIIGEARDLLQAQWSAEARL